MSVDAKSRHTSELGAAKRGEGSGREENEKEGRGELEAHVRVCLLNIKRGCFIYETREYI